MTAARIGIAALSFALLAQTGYGTVRLENKTDRTLIMYVDGDYGCQALKGLGCNAQVKAGTNIKLEAKDGDDVVDSETIAELKSGATHTFDAND